MHLDAQQPVLFNWRTFTWSADMQRSEMLGPGPRGQIVVALKKKPCSVKELSSLTHLNPLQVRWYLKTLKDRCLLAEGRATYDARIVIYRLKTMSYEEPPKPVLTPSIIPLTDEENIWTWYERLIIAENGGPAIQFDESPNNIPKVSALPIVRRHFPKILIAGGCDSFQRSELRREFGKVLDLSFYDDRHNNQKNAMGYCRRADHVFLRTDYMRHLVQRIVRTSRKPFTIVRGNLDGVASALRDFCASLEKLNG